MIIVHAADLHLDSPLIGLGRYEGAPVSRIRGATRRALQNLVDLCIERGAALLLLAGDLYDGNWRDYVTGLVFTKELSRLREAGVRVVMIRGNHDAASQITKSLRLPDNVKDLSTRAPETVVFEDLGVACHGQGFATRAVTDDLASRYPPPVGGLLNIGLLHTALSGHEGHERYAPTTLEALKAKGYDYWALGHVHTRAVLSEDPWVVFPGNLQGRHARETGPKGATVLEVASGRVRSVEHVALDVVRFARCRLDLSDLAQPEELIDRAHAAWTAELERAEGRLLAIRVELTGSGTAAATIARDPKRWESELRALGIDLGGEEIWVERVDASSISVIEAGTGAGDGDLLGQLLGAIERAHHDPAERAELSEAVRDLTAKLPPEVDRVDPAVRLMGDEHFAAVLTEVKQLLVLRLSGTKAAR